jgi:hypothetical protein
MLDVGETLLKVKAYWRSKVALEEWWRLYEIPFSQRWGNTLMRASQHRDAMLAELERQNSEGEPNFKAALRVAEGKALPTGTQVPEPEAEAEDPDLVLVEPETERVTEWVATVEKLTAEITGATLTRSEAADLGAALRALRFAVKNAVARAQA